MAILVTKSGWLIAGTITKTDENGIITFQPADSKYACVITPRDRTQKVFNNGESLEEIEAYINSPVKSKRK